MIEVSIIIPCRNEEKFIGKCLDSIINQDYPKENLEVLVVDSASEDKTKEIIEEFKIKNLKLKIRLLDNPQKFTPFGLNLGIKEAKGAIIMRMDSHAEYPPDYISKCVSHLEESNADNVGGVIKTQPANNSLLARAIVLVLSHFFGAASVFRLGSKKPREVDTVFGGCYKREVFDKIGYFDERLIRSQDIEFNKRLKKSGGKILLFPEIAATYYPQATIRGFTRHNFQDGFWVIYPLKFGVRYFSLRHLIPLFFTTTVLISLILGLFFFWFKAFFVLLFGSYLLIILLISFYLALKNNLKLFFILPFAFFSRHFSYGLGSLVGFFKLL